MNEDHKEHLEEIIEDIEDDAFYLGYNKGLRACLANRADDAQKSYDEGLAAGAKLLREKVEEAHKRARTQGFFEGQLSGWETAVEREYERGILEGRKVEYQRAQAEAQLAAAVFRHGGH